MNASTIFFKTINFVWLKLLLGVITVVASVFLLAILLGIGMLFGECGVVGIMFCFGLPELVLYVL